MYLSSGLEARSPNLISQSIAERTSVAVLLYICAEARVLALQLPLPIGNQEPSNQSTHQREGGSDTEDGLDALLGVIKGFLNGSEHLDAYGSPSLPGSGSEPEEVAAKRGGKGLGATEECSDLGESVGRRAGQMSAEANLHRAPSRPLPERYRTAR